MTAFPEWIEPMAATLTYERFEGPEWIFERKLDGIRLLAFKNGEDVQLLSRNRLPKDIPTVAQAIANLPVSQVILDGELTWEVGAYHVFDVITRRLLAAGVPASASLEVCAVPSSTTAAIWRATSEIR